MNEMIFTCWDTQGKKIALVTGGNIGIGYEIVKGLLQDESVGGVIIATRNLDRGEHAISMLKSELPASLFSPLRLSSQTRVDLSLLAPASAPSLPQLCSQSRSPASSDARDALSLPRVSCLSLDLEDLDSVDRFAAEFRALRLPLHILVCNAGLLPLSSAVHLSPQGFERTMAVNHLGHFLLSLHLLPFLLLATVSSFNQQSSLSNSSSNSSISTTFPRVVFLSSMVHQYAEPSHCYIDPSTPTHPPPSSPNNPTNNLTKSAPLSTSLLYARSKLANVLNAYELQRRFAHLGLSCNVVHPGVVATDILKEAHPFVRLLGPLFMRLVGRSPATGALGALHLALHPSVDRRGGLYVDQETVHHSSPASYDPLAASQLWDASLKWVDARSRVAFPFQRLARPDGEYPKQPAVRRWAKVPWRLALLMCIVAWFAFYLIQSFILQ